MAQVYKFFGMGEKFIRVLKTITTNRTACIILDDGSTSKPFVLGTGVPQGNNPSLKQFNVVAQVLIFKIEFDHRIERIRALEQPPPLLALRADPPNNPGILAAVPERIYGSSETGRKTDKAEAFADDITGMGKNTPGALPAVKENLDRFAAVSSLKCNIDKSRFFSWEMAMRIRYRIRRMRLDSKKPIVFIY
jgi:Reverse transcriptase (RNA-dependent DNA polymerase)